MQLVITNICIGTEENELMARDMAAYLRSRGYNCHAVPDRPDVDKPISPFMVGVMARLMGGAARRRTRPGRMGLRSPLRTRKAGGARPRGL